MRTVRIFTPSRRGVALVVERAAGTGGVDRDMSVDRSAFVQQHGFSADVALHGRRSLNFDAAGNRERSDQRTTDDHFTRLDVTDHGSIDADDQRVGSVKSAFHAAVDANRTFRIHVAGDRQLIVDDRIAGGVRGAGRLSRNETHRQLLHGGCITLWRKDAPMGARVSRTLVRWRTAPGWSLLR